MIVKCESCQSRFKIGDEKVTERGVKVRCTKCGSIFTVRRAPAAEPEPEPEPQPEPPEEPEPSVFASAPAGPPAPPPDAFATDPAPLVENIFGQSAGASAGADLTAPTDPGLTPAFGSEAAPSEMTSSYGDLPGEWPPPELARPEPPPPPAGALASDPLDMPLDPLGATPLPSRIEEYWSNASPPGAARAKESILPDLEGAEDDPLAGLNLSRSLEHHEESNGNGAAIPSMLTTTDPTGPGFGELSQFQSDDNSEPLANKVGWEPTSEDSAAPPPEPAAQWTEELPVVPPPVEEPPLKVRPAEEEVAEERSIFDRVFRFAAGTSLLIVAVLGFVLYRNGGRIDLRHAGPSVSGALGLNHPASARETYLAAVEASGYYPTLYGSSLVFVTGKATNAGAKPVPLMVHLEVDDGSGHILGRADGLPGVVATPEDLYAIRGSSDLDALLRRLSATPPQPQQPGQTLPFTLVMTNPGVPLDGALLRVSAAPWAPPAGPVPAPPAGPAPAPAPAPSPRPDP
jgi:predicted Zn finger-like uncharacterized protein